MAVSEDLSKLSDELRKLSARAKEAEKHAAAARDKTKADIEADRDDARAVGEQQAQELREKADEGRERISIGGPMSREAGTRRSPKFAPTSTPAKQSTTCTRPSTAQTGPRKRRGMRSTSPTRPWSRPSTPCSMPRSRGWRPTTCPRKRLRPPRCGATPTGAEDPVRGSSALSRPSPALPLRRRRLRGDTGLPMDRNGDRGTVPLAPGATAVQPRASRASRGAVRAAVGGPERLCGSCLRSRRQRQDDAGALVARGRGLSEHTAWVAVEPRERDAQHFWLVGDQRAREGDRRLRRAARPDARISRRGRDRAGAGGPTFG